MRAPTVSVIMATYNHAPFVAKAIQSVLAQSNVELEFLISDDGSSDQTREVVASIHDPRIQFFPNIVNRGACVVTNELIERASGEFIALINSDDYWEGDDKLDYQVKVLKENPSLGATFGRALFVDKDGRALAKEALVFGSTFDQANRSQGEWLRQFFSLGNCLCHPTMLIRRKCYEELGMYSNRMRQLPDLDMWIRLVKAYPIHISERELINFRIMPGENASSQTATNSIRTINEHFLIADRFFDRMTAQQLIDGFHDLLVVKDVPTHEHLDIEKVLLYFSYNQWLGKPYLLIGLLKSRALLDSDKHRAVIESDYGWMHDRWFQQQMGEVDVLRPKIVAKVGHQKFRIKNALRKIRSFKFSP